ncbi:hypothetical protein [Paenibacillus sp. FSL R10-2734]|uniref:DUF7446 family protein n=1 Tax=Paenibacillus sp. FSL R10-2734 TaxID=2954691 RepID=UPI0030D815D5
MEVWCSPATGIIYAGYTKNGVSIQKIDVTKYVVNAVMQHMHVRDKNYECAVGELIFVPKAIVSTE